MLFSPHQLQPLSWVQNLESSSSCWLKGLDECSANVSKKTMPKSTAVSDHLFPPAGIRKKHKLFVIREAALLGSCWDRWSTLCTETSLWKSADCSLCEWVLFPTLECDVENFTLAVLENLICRESFCEFLLVWKGEKKTYNKTNKKKPHNKPTNQKTTTKPKPTKHRKQNQPKPKKQHPSKNLYQVPMWLSLW